MISKRCWVLVVGGCLAAVVVAQAQDARAVKEPILPRSCTVLKAAFTAAVAASGRIEMKAVNAGSDTAGLDTQRLQRALDQCPNGHAVELAGDGANDAFLSGPIALRAGVTLLIDKGVTLYASRNPESYATAPGSCGISSGSRSGCKPLLNVRNATGAAVMGAGGIDGQGGSPLMVNGRPAAESWWDVAEKTHGQEKTEVPRLINVDLSDNVTIAGVALRNAPGTHVSIHRGDGLTVWGVRIDTPASARDTTGILVEQAKNVTIARSYLRTGDDAVDLNAGDGPTSDVTIMGNHIYWGHGVVIGPETNAGISAVRVQDLSLDGSETGIRASSTPGHGGAVTGVTYEDVCIRGSRNPIVFENNYAFPGRGADLFPTYQRIVFRNVQISGGGRIRFDGFDDTHRIKATLDGVVLDKPARYTAQAIHTDFVFGPGPVNVTFTGNDSTIDGKAGKGTLPSCTEKFLPFPQ